MSKLSIARYSKWVHACADVDSSNSTPLYEVSHLASCCNSYPKLAQLDVICACQATAEHLNSFGLDIRNTLLGLARPAIRPPSSGTLGFPCLLALLFFSAEPLRVCQGVFQVVGGSNTAQPFFAHAQDLVLGCSAFGSVCLPNRRGRRPKAVCGHGMSAKNPAVPGAEALVAKSLMAE